MSLKNLFLQDKEKTGSKKEEEFSFGTAAEFKPDMAVKKILEVDDLSKLAHSNVSPFMLLWSVFYCERIKQNNIWGYQYYSFLFLTNNGKFWIQCLKFSTKRFLDIVDIIDLK